MATLIKNNGMFLHVPKTGGTTISLAIKTANASVRKIGAKHDSFERIITKFYADLNPKVKAFCFVRNPYTWYESCFRFMTLNPNSRWLPYKHLGHRIKKEKEKEGKRKDVTAWHPWTEIYKCIDSDFNTFIQHICDVFPGFLTNMYNQYIIPSFMWKVFKLEELSDSIRIINSEFDINLPNNKWCRKTIGLIPIKWNLESITKIRELEMPIFVRFGYPLEYGEFK